MINYETYCQIRLFHQQRGLSFNQIASELGIRPQTVAKYANLATFTRRLGTRRPSKLDPFKPAITRWLERHPYSATQIYQRLCADEGSVTKTVRVTNRCRVVLDTNRYSVPFLHASQSLTLKAFADRLCLYHSHNLVASHPRCYERHRDFENPDHVKELLAQRHRARDSKWLMTFYALSSQAEYYHQQLTARSLQARTHINKIVALTGIYGTEKVALALEDAIASQAFSSEYIENILQQRERHTPQPGPLHLTRRADLLEIQLPSADLSLYDPK